MNEEEILHFARAATAAHVEKLVRGWRLVDQQEELNEANRLHLSRSLQVWTDEDGTVLDVGRKRRTLHPALRRALHHRDRHCQFPACENRFCEAHHIHHWAAGGETKLENLILVCRAHHRTVHEEGVRVEADAEGEIVFRRPDGSRVDEAPVLPWLRTSGTEAIRGRLEDAGIELDPKTCTPTWNADSFHLGWAIDGLRRLGGSGKPAGS